MKHVVMILLIPHSKMNFSQFKVKVEVEVEDFYVCIMPMVKLKETYYYSSVV